MTPIEELQKAITAVEIQSVDVLRKSHVSSYTRKDGTVVKEHDDSRDVRKEMYNNAKDKAEIASGEADDRESHIQAAKAHRQAAGKAEDSKIAYMHRQRADEHDRVAAGKPSYRSRS